MSVVGKSRNLAKALVLSGGLGRVLADGITHLSRTAAILASRADIQTGPMGDDIEMMHETENATVDPTVVIL